MMKSIGTIIFAERNGEVETSESNPRHLVRRLTTWYELSNGRFFDGRFKKEKIIKLYCSSCSSFRIRFDSGGYYECTQGLEGWNTGRCERFNEGDEMEYGRLVYWTYGSQSDLPTWESFAGMAKALVTMVTGLEPDTKDNEKLLDQRAKSITPRKPSRGNVIARAIDRVRPFLRNEKLLWDEIKSGGSSKERRYRVFARREAVGDVEHLPDQLLIFNCGTGAIEAESVLDDEVRSRLEYEIKYVQKYVFQRDVRTLAQRVLHMLGAVVPGGLGGGMFIILPDLYDTVETVGSLFSMIGLSIKWFALAEENANNISELITDALVEEVNGLFENVKSAVKDLNQKKRISDRLGLLEQVRGRIAVYSAILGDAQDGLEEQLQEAEASVRARLAEFDK